MLIIIFSGNTLMILKLEAFLNIVRWFCIVVQLLFSVLTLNNYWIGLSSFIRRLFGFSFLSRDIYSTS
jgi:hypothetical protein